MIVHHRPARRRFLRLAAQLNTTAAATLAASMLPGLARAAAPGERRLSLLHTHTGEHLALTYAQQGQVLPAAQRALDHFLRDHYSGSVGRIDPQLFELLHGVQQALGRGGVFEIISGFRSADTNERLRRSRGGGVARHSLHLEGRAIDLRLPGVPLTDLRDAARTLRGGGVGFYASEHFVHLDTGRVRTW